MGRQETTDGGREDVPSQERKVKEVYRKPEDYRARDQEGTWGGLNLKGEKKDKKGFPSPVQWTLMDNSSETSVDINLYFASVEEKMLSWVSAGRCSCDENQFKMAWTVKLL